MRSNKKRALVNTLVAILTISTMLLLIFVPWIVSILFSPLRPPQLAETPTAYQVTKNAIATQIQLAAISSSTTSSHPPALIKNTVSSTSTPAPTVTPIPTSTPSPSPTPTSTPTPTSIVASGSSSTALPIYSCPGEKFRTGHQIPPHTSFTILGWNDTEDITWLLVKDDPREPQEWVKTERVKITPPNYQNYVTGPIACRIVQH